MSFGIPQTYPFSVGQTVVTTPFDINLQLSYPGIEFSGQETSGGYDEIREINGALWLVTNAQYNKTTLVWNQVNAANPSYALVLTSTGAIQRFTAAAVGSGTLPTITFANAGLPNFGYSFQRNKILNGAKAIDQRNNGATITPTNGQYGVDKWKFLLSQASKFTAGQLALTPSLGVPAAYAERITSSSAYTSLAADYFYYTQGIEAQTLQELAWGTSAAQPLTHSFWVRNSVAGTYSVAFQNTNATRSYVATYTTTAGQAGNFQYVTVTIPGDTAGTWTLFGSGAGLFVLFDLGCGTNYQTSTLNAWQSANVIAATGATRFVATNGQTMDISAVQVETGGIATPFEQRLYGAELSLCQRYCFVMTTTAYAFGSGGWNSATQAQVSIPLPVPLRAAPTFAASGPFQVTNFVSAWTVTTGPSFVYNAQSSVLIQATASTATATAGQAANMQGTGTASSLTFAADY